MIRTLYKKAMYRKVGRGRPSKGAKPEKEEFIMLYIKESRSIREIADMLGYKKDVVHYWLKKYGIPTRTMAKRSKLIKYSLSELIDGVKKRGKMITAQGGKKHEKVVNFFFPLACDLRVGG
jgi:predicted DNA-binding protein YlxM (UPF0122 family)